MKRVFPRASIREGVAVAALALAATGAFFYEYLPPARRVHLFSDIEGFHYPLAAYAFNSLEQGRVPQWDPSIYCGITFAGNIQAALFYPPSWLMYAASWRCARFPFLALEIFAFAHVWLAFLLCYGWLRSRGLDKLPSTFGAGVFAFGGYMVGQIVHLGAETGLAWMPLGLWGVDEAVRRRDWRPLWRTALASAMSFLAGYPDTWIVFCATVTVYALMSPGRLRTAAAVSGAIAGSILLAMVQWLPALTARAHMFQEERYGGGLDRWSDLLIFLVPNWYDFNRQSTAPIPSVLYLYLGLPAIFALGWAAVACLCRRGGAGGYAQPVATALFCLLFAANPGFLMYRLLAHFPVMEKTLQSYNFYEGIAAMAALVTALAMNDYLSRAPSRKLGPWAVAVPAAALVACCAREIRDFPHGGKFAVGIGSLIETAAMALAFALALWVLRRQSGAARAGLAALLVLSAGVDYKTRGTGRRFNTVDVGKGPSDQPGGIEGMNSAASRALWQNRHFRVALDDGGGPYSTDLRRWGLATPQGFDPLLPLDYRRAVERWTTFATNRTWFPDAKKPEMLRYFGIRYFITHEGVANDPFMARSPDYRMVAVDDSFYRVYEYLRAQAPFGWEDGKGEARPAAWLPERREFRVRSERGGRFCFAERFYPGWRATVDGRAAPIERWNGVFQSIQAGPGEHTIVFRYREKWLPSGGAVSLAALAALALVVKAERRRRPGPAAPGAPTGEVTA